MQFSQDNDLLGYFTDMDSLRNMFSDFVAAPNLPKRLIIIHGVGGIGKSSLLYIFRLHCRNKLIPAGLASGDDSKSVVDVLSHWSDDLKTDHINLPKFNDTLQKYREILVKVQEEARKEYITRNKVAQTAGKVAVKTFEAATSLIPVIGPVASIFGSLGMEALVDRLLGFLAKPDVDLLLDPSQRLTDVFLLDIAGVAAKQRLVLMLDTFEQMTTLEDWTRNLVQQLHPNILLVIAGRGVPNWGRAWSGWIAQARIEEIQPMTPEDMRVLVSRYYAYIRGGEPDRIQVDAIIQFARGLPMVVNTAVHLWAEYNFDDFQSIKVLVAGKLVDRLKEGVPISLVPLLEAAAVLRWFNKEMLRVITEHSDISALYDELRRFPFVRSRVEGLALHDVVRELIDDNLRVQDPERHRVMHERASTYFEQLLEKATGEESQRFNLERLYHKVRADEAKGIELFQSMAEEIRRYRLISRLRALLKDVNSYQLERDNSKLWRSYYTAQLAYMESKFDTALEMYEAISCSRQAEQKLQAYSLCGMGTILKKTAYITRPGGLQRLADTLERSDNLLADSDPKVVINATSRGEGYQRLGELDLALPHFEKAIDIYKAQGDEYSVANILSIMMFGYARNGDWKKSFELNSSFR